MYLRYNLELLCRAISAEHPELSAEEVEARARAFRTELHRLNRDWSRKELREHFFLLFGLDPESPVWEDESD